jgi:hypothetical protein
MNGADKELLLLVQVPENALQIAQRKKILFGLSRMGWETESNGSLWRCF